MPKRTNSFQSVIFLIKKHMSDENTVVTESAELVDRVTGTAREVDVLIETEITGHPVRISLECGARGRKQDVEWVDRMHGKHSTLPTNQLVLVSESGFTPEALKKAQALGIETVVPGSATDASIGELVHRFTQARYTKIDMLNIANVYLTLGATETEEKEEDVHLLPEAGNIHVFTESRKFIGVIKDVILNYMTTAAWDESVTKETIQNAPDDAHFFELILDPPKVIAGGSTVHEGIFFEKTEPALHLRRIEQLRITGEAQIERSVFPLQGGMFKDTAYCWGESTIAGAPAVIVLTASSDGSLKITPKTY